MVHLQFSECTLNDQVAGMLQLGNCTVQEYVDWYNSHQLLKLNRNELLAKFGPVYNRQSEEIG